MKMQTMIVIVCLGLLLLVEPASAQLQPASAEKGYSLKFSIHEEVQPLTPEQIDLILERASNLLNGQKCNVKFKLDGPIEKFTSASAPKDINDPSDLEKVHSVGADPLHTVKVVRSIKYCIGRFDEDGFIGCAWRAQGPKTVIVTRADPNVRHILLAHEFGHTKGLVHRDDLGALMNPKVEPGNIHITSDECKCYREEVPGGC
jgi:hypothetical protein